jgi:hypothetical protein
MDAQALGMPFQVLISCHFFIKLEFWA